MSNLISSLIFCCRNTDKAEHGEVGRIPVAIGQATKVGKAVANYHNTVSKGSKSAVTVFEELANKNKAIKYTGQALDWASKNVNPLICASGVVKVGMSDDKVSAGIKEFAALSTMFAGEALMKEHLDELMNSKSVVELVDKLNKTKCLKPLMKKIAEMKCGNSISAVLKGLLFVGGSITSYAIGEHMGKDLAHEVKLNYGLNTPKINQMA